MEDINKGGAMGEDLTKDLNAVQDPGGDISAEINTPGNQDGVFLSSEQYAALLDHVSSLEAKIINDSGPQGKKDIQNLDDLIDAGTTGADRGGKPNGQKLEEMSPEQVVDHIAMAIHQKFIAPLEAKVETLRLMNEIDKVANAKGNEDFWEYAGRVKEIAIQNPTLSIRQAYHLAKQEGTRRPAPSGEQGLNKKSDVLYTLPPRPNGKTNIAGGERGGASQSTLRENKELSRRDAASEAFDAAVKGK